MTNIFSHFTADTAANASPFDSALETPSASSSSSPSDEQGTLFNLRRLEPPRKDSGPSSPAAGEHGPRFGRGKSAAGSSRSSREVVKTSPPTTRSAYELLPPELRLLSSVGSNFWEAAQSPDDDVRHQLHATLESLPRVSRGLHALLGGFRASYAMHRAANRSHETSKVAAVLARLNNIDNDAAKQQILNALLRNGISRAAPPAEQVLGRRDRAQAEAPFNAASRELFAQCGAIISLSTMLLVCGAATAAFNAMLGEQRSPSAPPQNTLLFDLCMTIAFTSRSAAPDLAAIIYGAKLTLDTVRAWRQINRPELLIRGQLAPGGRFRELLDLQKAALADMAAPHILSLKALNRGGPLAALCRLNLNREAKAALLQHQAIPQLDSLPFAVCVEQVLPDLLKNSALPKQVITTAIELLRRSEDRSVNACAFAQACGALIPHLDLSTNLNALAFVDHLIADDGPLHRMSDDDRVGILVILAAHSHRLDGERADSRRAQILTLSRRVPETSILRDLLLNERGITVNRAALAERLDTTVSDRALTIEQLRLVIHVAEVIYADSPPEDQAVAHLLTRAADGVGSMDPKVHFEAATCIVHSLRKIRSERNDEIVAPLIKLLGPSMVVDAQLESLVELLATEVGSPETFDQRRLSLAMETHLDARLNPAEQRTSDALFDKTTRIAHMLARLVDQCPYMIRETQPERQPISILDAVPLMSSWQSMLQRTLPRG